MNIIKQGKEINMDDYIKRQEKKSNQIKNLPKENDFNLMIKKHYEKFLKNYQYESERAL